MQSILVTNQGMTTKGESKMDATEHFLAQYVQPGAPKLPPPHEDIGRIQLMNEYFKKMILAGAQTIQQLSHLRFVG